MKVSEFLLLGSMSIKPQRGGDEGMEVDRGCALTMAGFAAGIKPEVIGKELDGTPIICSVWEQAYQKWPWLISVNGGKCPSCGTMLEPDCAFWMVAHIFDSHVAEGTMTIESLADYVRSIEPPDPEPEPFPVDDEQPEEVGA